MFWSDALRRWVARYPHGPDGKPLRSMRVIAEQLGHANPSLTARVYAHVVPAAQRAAVASLERSGS